MAVHPNVLASWLREMDRNIHSGQIYMPLPEEKQSLRPQIYLKDTSGVSTIETWSPISRSKIEPKVSWNTKINIDTKANYGISVDLKYFLDGVQRTSLIRLIRVLRTGEQVPIHIGQVGSVIISREKRILNVIKDWNPIEYAILLPKDFIIDITDDTVAKTWLSSNIDSGFSLYDTSYESAPEKDTITNKIKIDANGNEKHKRIPNSTLKCRINDLNFFRDAARKWIRRIRALQEQNLHTAFADKHGPAEIEKNKYEFLIIDGTITDVRSKVLTTAIGISKTFNTRFLNNKQQAKVVHLSEYERSPVFLFKGQDEGALEYCKDVKQAKGFKMSPRASWYLRIRDASGNLPNWGLLRVEVHPDLLPSKGSADLWSEDDYIFINSISSAIIKERLPVSQPDNRWHNLIYPIKNCEDYLRSLLIPHESIVQIRPSRG
ncbi:MAG: hypothetical protein ACTSW1_01205 [Candidatus Hodarchaeales archaeon]